MNLSQEILDRFDQGMKQAIAAGVVEPTAMDLATCINNCPESRTVLLKGLDARGFVFYTNLESRKGQTLKANPVAALTFLWLEIAQQVLVRGQVELVSDQEADEYFASRPRGSQVGAWASRQSQPLDSRATLEHRVAELEQRFASGPVPRPEFWSGYRVLPEWVEFWYGQESRLHDRFLYQNIDGQWQPSRLYP